MTNCWRKPGALQVLPIWKRHYRGRATLRHSTPIRAASVSLACSRSTILRSAWMDVAGIGQHLPRAALAQRQIRRRVFDPKKSSCPMQISPNYTARWAGGSAFAPMNLANARVRIARKRCASVNCIASGFQQTQEARQTSQNGLYCSCRVCAGDRQTRLSGMFGLRGDAMQQQWSTGDRLEVFVRMAAPYEQRPPVVNQCPHARHDAAACEVLGGKAAQPH